MASHLTLEELHHGLEEIARSPIDHGALKAIVIRPSTDERVLLKQCRISPEGGVHGDYWSKDCWMSLPDGRPHPPRRVMSAGGASLPGDETAELEIQRGTEGLPLPDGCLSHVPSNVRVKPHA
jgi:hypothetical protein